MMGSPSPGWIPNLFLIRADGCQPGPPLSFMPGDGGQHGSSLTA